MSLASPSLAEPTSLHGLTEREALERRQRGQGNNVVIQTGRTYGDILRQNIFTFVNTVLFSIGIVLVLLGLYTDALLSVGIALMNVVVGVVQEMRAKRTLDKIALLTRPKASVIREGREQVIDPTEIVLGDILLVRPGDQIVVDGAVVGDSKMEVDESLLTGESDLIPKSSGDTVYSGSFCVTGSAYYEARQVGHDSFANKLTASARAFRQVKTPLQTDIDFVIRILLLLSLQLALLFGVAIVVNNTPATESAKIAAVITGLIPNGLFFMISVAYAMGAVRMAGQGALIQQSNAVESMSNVNVLCLDKTGTLTANRIHLHELMPLGTTETELRRLLGSYAASGSSGNRTADALSAALGGERRRVTDEIPFSSARKWSALAFDHADLRGVYVLGAPEMLRSFLDEAADLGSELHTWAERGLRVLLFAYRPEVTPLHNSLGQPQLPPDLIPLGVLSFSDELRPEAEATLKGFAETGIQLKIISGDNPQTVAALAKQAGLAGDVKVVSGSELDDLDDFALAKVAEDTTIFGRITPQQKEKLVDALRSKGYYVAMIGDGVNDVLSLKKAQIGIAMQGGSQATRGVADIILLNDSFAALPPAFREGQRIINGMQDIMRLFLTRVVYQTLIIVGVAIIGLGFPTTPVHTSLLTLFTVGTPTLALAAWSRPGAPKQNLMRAVLRFVIPAGFTLALVGLLLYVYYYVTTFTNAAGVNSVAVLKQALAGLTTDPALIAAQSQALDLARTVLTTLTTFAGLLFIIFVEPPPPLSRDTNGSDWRPTIMAGILLAIYLAMMAAPGLRTFFELAALEPRDYGIIGGVTGLWALTLWLIWRSRLADRVMGLKGSGK
jgi:cation-transporting ATPase E